jgi:hypothetical protein
LLTHALCFESLNALKFVRTLDLLEMDDPRMVLGCSCCHMLDWLVFFMI